MLTANTASESTTTTTPRQVKLNLSELRRKIQTTKISLNQKTEAKVQVEDKIMDLVSLKEHLDQKKKVQVENKNIKPKYHDYVSIDEFSPSARAATRPANKLLVATPCFTNNSIPELIVEDWQCACCHVINEAKHSNCKKCQMTRGSLSASHAHCGLCNLIAYISEEEMNCNIYCPLCKEVI